MIEVPGRCRDSTEEEQRGWVVGMLAQNVAVDPLRLREPPGAVMCDGGIEGVVDCHGGFVLSIRVWR